MLLICCRFLR